MHEFPRSNRWLSRRLMKRLAAIVVITRELKDLVVAEGVEPGRVTVAPDGVDLAALAISETKQQCRQLLGLPSDMRLIVYTGHLWSWKGVYVLAEAAAFLSADCLVLFVGGMEYDLEKLKRFVADRGLPRIQFVGLKPPAEIAYWLAAADCLVLPNSGQRGISRRYTSPLKLFEYMAAPPASLGSPVAALLEILNERH